MKIKTSELAGYQLDWSVAKAAEIPTGIMSGILYRKDFPGDTYGPGPIFKPSADWSQGGPLIEKYDPDERRTGLPSGCRFAEVWVDFNGDDARRGHGNGETRLIAFCRALVAAKLGEEIEVPEELV